jgi:zinc/manganese transport system substrate-binding protein
MASGRADPHFWLDPVRMASAVTLIGDALADLEPQSAEAMRTKAAGYRDAVLAVHETISERLAAVPADRRLVVTDHDSLGYFADRYGLAIAGVVIPGGSTLAEPSAGDLAELITMISETGVRAIFADTTQPADIAEAIARESEHDVAVVPLYTGSLGEEGSGAETYLSMMLLDAERIASALAG